MGAGALTVALVAANVLGLAGWRGGADAAAASVLESAAIKTLNVSDPVVGPGQYLMVTTDAVYASFGRNLNGAPSAYLEKHRGELYVPADQSDDWVWVRAAGETYETFGPASEAFAKEMQPYAADELLRAPAGAFYGGSPAKTADDYESLPRDPHQLLNAIYAQNLTIGRSPDGEALVWIADALRNGTAPAELRSALYKAAALIPGVTVTEEQATLDGTTGIAIGRVEASDNSRQDIVIDPESGQFIGERQVSLETGGVIPAGTAVASTTVTTTVVDSAPAGGTPDGD
jgi:RNA polymerase sigma-70 factor (ECF subfamily)